MFDQITSKDKKRVLAMVFFGSDDKSTRSGVLPRMPGRKFSRKNSFFFLRLPGN